MREPWTDSVSFMTLKRTRIVFDNQIFSSLSHNFFRTSTHTRTLGNPLNFSTFNSLSSPFFRTFYRRRLGNSFVFNFLTSISIFLLSSASHRCSPFFANLISFLLLLVILFFHDFNVSKFIFSLLFSLARLSCLNCDDTKKKRKRKKITTAIFKRQSSSVGWKLRKIICFVGKYKENFLLLRKLLRISSRLRELREISLPLDIDTLTFANYCQLPCYLCDWMLGAAQDYRNFNICLKNRIVFSLRKLFFEQVESKFHRATSHALLMSLLRCRQGSVQTYSHQQNDRFYFITILDSLGRRLVSPDFPKGRKFKPSAIGVVKLKFTFEFQIFVRKNMVSRQEDLKLLAKF